MQIFMVRKYDRIGEGYEVIGIGSTSASAEEIRQAYFNGGIDRNNDYVTITECSTDYFWQ